MNVYLHLPKYLRQWVLHDFGDAEGVVRFPRGSAEHDVLSFSLTKQPKNAKPQLPAADTIAIELPELKHKPLPFYCYLTESARKMLAQVILVRFRVMLWHDMHNIDRLQCSITDVIYDWMERHGIENDPTSWETIRQTYFRQRKKYRQEN